MQTLGKSTLTIGTGSLLFLVLCLGSALASGTEIIPGARDPSQDGTQERAGAEAPPEDAPSFLRKHTWQSSFDRAGDASRAAEVELKKGIKIHCEASQFEKDGVSQEAVLQMVRECQQRNAEAQTFGEEAGKIRVMQRIFADTSRISDAAAVGSIGAVGYAELIKKNQSQSETLLGAAKIQETAGYVSYTTGAADFSMGAYAYLSQKKKLEKMKETLSGVSGNLQMNAEDIAAVKKLATAAEETKKAAYSHMMYGAGKAAVGYASMWMAKRNKDQAASLASIDSAAYLPPASPSTISNTQSTNNGGTAYYPNNNVQFLLPTDNSGASVGNPGSTNAAVVAGGGASVMPSEFRNPASNSSGGKGGVSSSGSPGGAGAPSAKGGGTESTDGSAGLEANKDGKETASQGFEISLAGGNSNRYGGGSGEKSKDDGGVGDLLGGLMGSGAESKATGVNPNQIYRSATEDLDGTEEVGSMAGVGNKDRTLFEAVRSKYFKMMEVGRLQGPGAVEVKN